MYRFGLTDNDKRIFEKIAVSCEYFPQRLPISFVLGFYVTIVVQRWWAQYMLILGQIPYCIMVATTSGLIFVAQDERGRLLRKSFARYINLAFALAFARIAPRVARRFSTYDQFIEGGYMTSNEKEIFEMMDKQTRHHKIWMPLVWASMVAAQARREGRCPDDYGLKAMIKEITNLRYNCGKLQEYHTMSVPLVYTQVVTMATYSYFAFSILGRQFLDPKQGYDNHSIDFYVPIFTFLQFIFYMGWLKVAESLLNPFGDDDDDFDTNDFLDRHLEISYMIVDVMHKSYPDVLTDPAKEDTSYFNVSTTSPVTDTYNKENLTHKANVVNRSIKGEKCPPVIKDEQGVHNKIVVEKSERDFRPQNISRLCSETLRRTSYSPVRHNGDVHHTQYGDIPASVLRGLDSCAGSAGNVPSSPIFTVCQEAEVTVHTQI
ncbi:bestrophin-2-like [Homarus americanus]|uniref:bestrophin-2-like n=1 Tax=Homarus americanus TaxID=6706 RepID=UPI001C493D0A|nr:bestrophin-2-like [Homarus americanus]